MSIEDTTTNRADLLRSHARYFAVRSLTNAVNRDGLLDDFQDLPRAEAEAIVDQEFARFDPAAGRAVPAPRSRPIPATLLPSEGRPALPITADALADALRLAGWRLRWNPLSQHVEAKHDDTDDWREASGLTRDIVMEDVASAALLERGSRYVPFRIASARLETRLLVVVAARNVADPGEVEGGAVYETVGTWATGDHLPQTMTDILTAAKVLQHFESAARAPKVVYRDAAAALTAAGWHRKSTRTPDGPRKLWHPPARRSAPGAGSSHVTGNGSGQSAQGEMCL